MKKLIFLFTLLIAFVSANAQVSFYCNNGCYPLPIIQPNNIGVSAGVYEFKVDSGIVQWNDADASPYCTWKWSNPNYSGYTVEVYQDGILFNEAKNYSTHGVAADNIPDPTGAGPFHYYYPIGKGHSYRVRVGKQCNAGGIAWSPFVDYATAATATVTGATAPAGIAKPPKKK